MKHILYILPYLEGGGTEKQALSLIQHFQHHYNVSLLAPNGSSLDKFTVENIKYYSFPRLEKDFIQGISDFYRNLKLIDQNQPIDLIHVHAAHELTLLTKLFLPRVPVVFTVHGYHGRSSQVSYRLSVWFSNRFANAVIAVCQAEQKILLELGLKPSKLNLIYNGVSETQVDSQESQIFIQQFSLNPTTKIVIGTAARLTEAKGLSYLISAFSQLTQSHSNLQLVIAGSGELESELKQLTKTLNIQDQIIFVGYIDNLPALMQLFHIFVLPSLQEAFSLACIEAMAQKKAVVGTNIGGINEQVIDGETGFIVPAKDVNQLAEKIDFIIRNSNLIQEFGSNGYQRFKQNFTTEIMLEKTANLYIAIRNDS